MSHDDIEAIKQLKHRYGRAVDLREIDVLEDLLTSDFYMDVSPHNDLGTINRQDREATFKVFRERFTPDMIIQHQMHAPEIKLTGDTTAEGVWYLEYFSCNVKTRHTARGTSLYFDRYVKQGGKWKLAYMKYQLVYRIEEPLAADAKIVVHRVGWEAAQHEGQAAAGGVRKT
jgi:hypothetical protein